MFQIVVIGLADSPSARVRGAWRRRRRSVGALFRQDGHRSSRYVTQSARTAVEMGDDLVAHPPFPVAAHMVGRILHGLLLVRLALEERGDFVGHLDQGLDVHVIRSGCA